jgi:hypothetical protein
VRPHLQNIEQPDGPEAVRWRAVGAYLPTNASKAGLVDETRQFLLSYGENRDVVAAAQVLVDGGLRQRSRDTRVTIVKIIKTRLFNWRPPEWVLDDLVAFAGAASHDALKPALLLHTARQDVLLYDVVQKVIAPAWSEGRLEISRADVQRYLDAVSASHTEVDHWSRETREKLAGNLLTILRDYGLFAGGARTTHKQLVEPYVPDAVARHLAALLAAEGVNRAEAAHHPDWRLWLWSAERAERFLQMSIEMEKR